jgi:predicted O-linked N-acetylglucosamine transferase (SPINDLY family)
MKTVKGQKKHVHPHADQLVRKFQTTQLFTRHIDQLNAQGVARDEVFALYEQWLSKSSDEQRFLVWYNYGSLLQLHGRIDEAVDAYKQSLALAPHFPPPVVNWGLCEELKGNRELALEIWREGLPHFPTHHPELLQLKVAALNHLARVSEEIKDYAASGTYLQQSLSLDSNQPDAIHHWVHLQQLTCQWPVLKPVAGISVAKQLLFTSPFAMLAFTDEPALQLLSAREYVHRKFGVTENTTHRGGSFLRHGKGRLRIGYVSGDLCTHAVGLLMPSVLASHDRERVELFAYDFSPEDGTTLRSRLLGQFDHLRSLKGLSDAQAASQIVEDGIDVLLDMHGLSQGARPGIFALRPAPRQGQYLGFIGTTGMPWLDFVVVDRYVFTPALRRYFTEEPLFVDGCFLPITPSEVAPKVFTRSECGLPDDAFVLAAFGNSYKVTEAMFALWLSIMKEAPSTVLWILNDNVVACEQLRSKAISAGVGSERLFFQPRVPYGEFSARLRVADLFLDAYPYNCGSTARDVMQAGLPMVSLSGQTLVSRMGGSVLCSLGEASMIAKDVQDYKQKVLDAIDQAGAKPASTHADDSRRSLLETRARRLFSVDWGRGVTRAIEARFLLGGL